VPKSDKSVVNVSPGSDFGPEGFYTLIQNSPHKLVQTGWWLWEGAMPLL